MNFSDIENRFMFHPPKNLDVVKTHEGVRTSCLNLAIYLNNLLPESREKSLAMTKLEEVMMWSNAAIARSREEETSNGTTGS